MKSNMVGLVLVAMSLVVASNSIGQEKGTPRPKIVTGLVSKVDASALTITQRGDGGDRSTVFAIGAQTKILIQTNEDNTAKGEGGKERKVPKTKEGKLVDVKVEQRVSVGFIEAGKADTILILRPTPPRKGEGEK